MIIGLLGLGTIGSGIYEHLEKRGDIKVKRIVELKRHPGLEHLETSDFGEVLNDPEIDVVSLALPHHLHKEFALAAAAAGKHIMLDKPLARTVEEG